jgi:hypothetical protein
MKPWLLLPVLAAALAAGAIAGSEPAAVRAPDPELKRLQERIDALEGRVKNLEDRLQKLEAAQRAVEPWRNMPIPPQPTPLVPPRVPMPDLRRPSGPGAGPEIWGERRINGWTFYIVPCADQATAALPANRLGLK